MLINNTQVHAIALIGFCHIPSVYGPGMNFTREAYILRARITAAYDMSRAGAVILKIATMVAVLPMAIVLSAQVRRTMSQTE